MKELITDLHMRRKKVAMIVLILALIATIVSYYFVITPATYFDGQYNAYFIYALIVYKIIELYILYYILLYRNIKLLRRNLEDVDRFTKLKKHTKLLFFLVPQGNTVFGVIAYKLSGDVIYFLLFSCIALITLYLIKPDKLNL